MVSISLAWQCPTPPQASGSSKETRHSRCASPPSLDGNTSPARLFYRRGHTTTTPRTKGNEGREREREREREQRQGLERRSVRAEGTRERERITRKFGGRASQRGPRREKTAWGGKGCSRSKRGQCIKEERRRTARAARCGNERCTTAQRGSYVWFVAACDPAAAGEGWV